MAYSIEEGEAGIREACLEGNVLLEDAREIRGITAKNCREKNLERVLVDVSRATSIADGSTLDLYQLGSDGLLEIDFPMNTRVALILPATGGSAEDWRFLAAAEKNRGLTTRVFTDKAEASAWLKG